MASMEIHALESLRKKAQASSQMLHYRPMEYFLRAMLAGVFIGLHQFSHSKSSMGCT